MNPVSQPVFVRSDLFREVFEGFPHALLIMDERLRILHLNRAAATLSGTERKAMLYRQNGDAFHCVHAGEHPEGCGHAPACAKCAVRQSVEEVLAGRPVVQRNHHALLGAHGHVRELHLRLTASALRHDGELLALVMLEDTHAPPPMPWLNTAKTILHQAPL
ncbi:MAG: PAS domain-containing protein [Verrucomicrobiae bacterium]|nr:PAS domain-containing protein [Verrucomicrobiae bacterium]